MIVQNMQSSNGNKVANQFILTDKHKMGNNTEYFQSYKSIIVKKIYDNIGAYVVETFLDQKYWNFSNTTSKYRNQFLNETTKETKAKIKSGEYKLIDLNN
tara:strand:+ start:588 stop:887 length:300 start_codon:yes stop_codon:yes gene_type:complete